MACATIVGVMPAGFLFPEEAASVDFWVPLAADFVALPGTMSMAEERVTTVWLSSRGSGREQLGGVGACRERALGDLS